MDFKFETLSDIIPEADRSALSTLFEDKKFKIFIEWFVKEYRVQLAKKLYMLDDQRQSDRTKGQIDALAFIYKEMKKLNKKDSEKS